MRSEDDKWDLGSSVGKTAIVVAQGRALDTLTDDPLVSDEYAARFLSAAGESIPDSQEPTAVTLATVVGLRTRFFDDDVTASAAAGIHQFVLLAAGLDARAFRLPWAPGTTLFEVDQHAVIDFKDRVLAELGAIPSCARTTVGIDLRDDWNAGLLASGFDPSLTTAWVAEGLTLYLSDAAQERLFETIAALSAPSSRFVYDVVGQRLMDRSTRDELLKDIERDYEFDIDALVYARPFDDEAWLAQHGWAVESDLLTSVAERYARPVLPALRDLISEYHVKTAVVGDENARVSSPR